MSTPSTLQLVNEFLKSSHGKDPQRLRHLMADDFRFEGPFDTFTSPEPYLAALAKLAPMVKGVKVLKVFVDGDEACAFYEMETAGLPGPVLVGQLFVVARGKITAVRAVFDARPFAVLFGGR